MNAEQWFVSMLEPAGIKLNGNGGHDIKVHNTALFERVRNSGTLGFGEAYMEGWWDCEKLDEMIYLLLRSGIRDRMGKSWRLWLHQLQYQLLNLQSEERASLVAEMHYDLGEELFEPMLGPTMAYSCGYWTEGVSTLDAAQEAKYDLICRKLHLRAGQEVLEIGCGWGGFAAYAAERYQVHVVGLTVSERQARYARKQCRNLPVEIRIQDYRRYKQDRKFDVIVSVGMFEHVGAKNYAAFMGIARRYLKDHGLFLLHTIGSKVRTSYLEPWMDRYIFTNGQLPALSQIQCESEGLFRTEDVHNFGASYDPTLMAWYRNYHAALASGSLPSRYTGLFARMWDYYLLSCAAAFRARDLQLYQLVLSPNGVYGGYVSAR